MKIAGVIAEYNPFHNGHRYQIEQIKKELSDAPLVVAMSGNFLQRGEPACFDKWTRAGEALQNGAEIWSLKFRLLLACSRRIALRLAA